MSEQKLSNNDSYNELLKSFSSSQKRNGISAQGQSRNNADASRRAADVSFNRPNNEEVTPKYYSGDSDKKAEPVKASAKRPEKSAAASDAEQKKAPLSDKQKKAQKKKKRRAKRRKSNIQSLLLVLLVLIFVFSAAFVIKIPIMGCVNDLIAMDRSDTEVRVTIEDGMNVDEIIDLLASKGLIYSSPFCKLAAEILSYSKDDVYPQGTYDLSPSLGLEGMLNEIISAGVKQNTVTLTFPEGYTVDQIIQKLSENNVAAAEDLYNAMDSEELAVEYDFLVAIDDAADRYSILEGYLYPDTYEFYIGENPISVIEKFLNNFARRWTSEYDDAAEALDMTVDEIMTLASILEKEAFDAQQMPLISSILYNRIKSTSFPFINCDSTKIYLEGISANVPSEDEYQHYVTGYDTYIKTGLPVGAICNPGENAIHAALYPDETDYYYFLHDPQGKIYVARTEEEHQSNMQYLGE